MSEAENNKENILGRVALLAAAFGSEAFVSTVCGLSLATALQLVLEPSVVNNLFLDTASLSEPVLHMASKVLAIIHGTAALAAGPGATAAIAHLYRNNWNWANRS